MTTYELWDREAMIGEFTSEKEALEEIYAVFNECIDDLNEVRLLYIGSSGNAEKIVTGTALAKLAGIKTEIKDREKS